MEAQLFTLGSNGSENLFLIILFMLNSFLEQMTSKKC